MNGAWGAIASVFGWFGSNWQFNIGWMGGYLRLSPNASGLVWVVLATMRLLLIALAIWRLAYMFVVEDGPFGLIDWLRRVRGVQRMGEGASGPAFTAFMCIKCMSVWMAFWLLFLPWEVSVVFSMSALAFIVHTKTAGRFM